MMAMRLLYQYLRETPGVGFRNDISQAFDEVIPIRIIPKDNPSFNSSDNYVMHRPGCVYSGTSRQVVPNITLY